MSRRRSIAAGVTAAAVWAAVEPVDRRIFGCRYSDVALLGKAVTRGPRWRQVGLTLHCLNGALAGAIYFSVARRLPGGRVARGVTFAMAEHLVSYPLTLLSDRYHPARGDDDLPPLSRSVRAFAQATFRHALFGVVLGILSSRVDRRPEETP
jgi:hypothetical protein